MAEEKKGFFKRLVSGLTKTRDNIVAGFDSLFTGYSTIDDDFYEELEEILIMGDLGVRATENIIEDLQRKVKEQHIKEPAECKELLIESIKEQMKVEETAYRFENEKSVVLVIGVNGVGKTTTVGKLAGKLLSLVFSLAFTGMNDLFCNSCYNSFCYGCDKASHNYSSVFIKGYPAFKLYILSYFIFYDKIISHTS